MYECLVTIHLEEDLTKFIEYEPVTNSFACILKAVQEVDCLQVMILAMIILGQQLTEGFLTLTYHGTVNYEKVKLYVDLSTTDPAKLLDLSISASFQVISIQI